MSLFDKLFGSKLTRMINEVESGIDRAAKEKYFNNPAKEHST